ncbi:hypothetical protein EI71_01915 [Anaeroplasma bactoclasticum]|jgi:hypothetical protein|uniref:Uncharacterized protein n=1 Tax=Anaeroplasma bactoclasticum TaxID=2088 RepID=A0A397QTL8_9MOLU|nr:hypothetical protein [Anaeroplasma bactoclasticum]RIA64763.1 hypothetical protein EI71_01915 [Anaeroplasma bactoclasticum]
MKLLRKTILSVAALTVTAVTFASVTYAWFPGYSEAKVKGFNLTVNGGLGFLVSVDGINYKSDLTKDEIQGAMLVKYAPTQYGWKYNETLAKSELYHLIPNIDDDGNPIGDGYTYGSIVTEQDKTIALNEIQLMPLTSQNGVKMTDLFNSEASVESGRFIEFQVYFRTTNLRGEYSKVTTIEPDTRYYIAVDHQYVETSKLGIEVNNTNVNQFYYKTSATDETYQTGLATYNEDYIYYQKLPIVKDITEKAQDLLDGGEEVLEFTNGTRYEVYLNGEEETVDAQYLNGVKINDAITISPTRFTSAATPVQLGAPMTTAVSGTPKTLNTYTDIDVYGANAIRLSITDENAFEASGRTTGSLIYELNDSEHGDSNYGSYATNYSDLYDVTNPNYSSELDYEYGYKNSASYTYYTNLKQNDYLHTRLMAYDEIPTTIKDLTGSDNKKITTLSSGEDGKLITFRIWLEGWDADCFDGIGGSIQSQLSFSSKRIN